MPNNLLITGESGVGKSTALSQAAEILAPRKISGFVSPRDDGRSTNPGWKIEGFGGVIGLVVDESIVSDHSLGKQGVDLALFESAIADAVASLASSDLVIVDEIGIVSELSSMFEVFLGQALASEIPLVAIVRQKGGRLVDQVRARADVELMTATNENRDLIAGDIARWVEKHDAD